MDVRSTPARSGVLALMTLAAAGPAHAAISQATISPPGGYIQAAAYTSTSGGGLIPGGDLLSSLGTPQQAQEFAFMAPPAGASASASAAATGTNISNNCSGSAGLGFLRASTFNSCPNSAFFAIAAVNGGWKETFTVSHPTLSGQPGFMTFQIRARGSMQVTGFAGSCGISTAGYKDNNELLTNGLFNRGNSDAISTDRQRAQWAISSFGQPDSRTVDDAITMAVPITFGQPFSLGIYAFARSSQRSSSGVGGISTGTLDFSSGGIQWGGITGVQSAGAPVTGFTITSASGINWNPPFGSACPPDFNRDGDLNPDDLSDFITCFFTEAAAPGACPDADFSADGEINADDLSDYITAYFGGCA